MQNPLTPITVGLAAVIVLGIGPSSAASAVAVAVGGLLLLDAWRRRMRSRGVLGGITLLVALLAIVSTLPDDGAPTAAAAARLLAILAVGALVAERIDRRTLARDLERRGLPRQVVYRVLLLMEILGAMRGRLREIAAVQTARGLPLDGPPLDRIRGRVPLLWPTLVVVLREVQDRTLALEARGFHRPGVRDLPWSPPDPPGERVVRWLILTGAIAMVILGLATRAP